MKRLLDNLKADFESAESARKDWEHYIRNMRAYYNGVAKPRKDGKSNYVSREVLRAVLWIKPLIKSPFVKNTKIIKANPLTKDDMHIARQTEKLINYFYTKKFKRAKFFDEFSVTYAVDGTAFIKTGWEYKSIKKEVEIDIIDDNTGEILGKKKQEIEIPIKSHPTAIVCDNNDIFIDPNARSIEEANFIIHRREVSLSQLKEEGIYENLDKIKIDDGDFPLNYEDKARKKFYMYEYWGKYDRNGDGIAEPVVCCWVDDVIIRLDDNPFPDGEPPFVTDRFEVKLESKYGMSMADIISDFQVAKTNILRGIFNDIKSSNSQQKGVLKGNLDSVNFKRWKNGEPFEFNLSPNGFYQGSYTQIPSYIFNVLQMVDMDEKALANINQEAGIGAQATYGSKASKSGQMTPEMIRESDIINNVSENIVKPMLRKWIAYAYEFMEPEDIQRITGMPYQDVSIEFIDGRMDFDITISTEQTDNVKASNLSFLLQTLGNNIPFDITKTIMAEIAELQKMDALADKIKEYEPQPNELEMKEKMLELKLLEASIMERYSRVKENEAEYAMKMAKAKESNSKAQMLDLETIRKKYGLDFKEELAKKVVPEKLKIDNYASKMAKSVLNNTKELDLSE